ncbi:hypothetical protein LTR37_003316 [Vermiconidia calcicola]|uniref:Uncharacterized protein n=1 Tax=Vermiconidia calcicola TaxID=1690605 RepID=A0ACC3NQK5_9PEZI|nr:hypothetical protein LTR37_003316 [Vermiconidia calcicola]
MVSAESQAAMTAAQNAVKEFMTKNGHHDTTVHELVRPAIYHTTITHNTREEEATAVDRELHQDHYHTSIQPITDEETVEEQHHEHILPVESRTFEHDDREEVQRRLNTEQAKFRDHVQRIEGHRTKETVPVVAGEHYHHHVHEVIQPVVNKHTVEPHVIHSLVRVREIHHQAAQHHQVSTLPAVSMAEFMKQGGILTGREERYDWFEGTPRSVGGELGHAHTTGGAATDHKTASSGAAQQGQTGTDAPRGRSGSVVGQNRDVAPSQASPQPRQASPQPQPQRQPTMNRDAAPRQTSPQPQPQRQPTMPAPERRASMPPPQAAPERRASMPPQQQQAPAPSPPAPAMPQTPRPQQPAPEGQAQPAAANGGPRWSLLPATFGGTHPPTRAGIHAGPVMQALHPPNAAAGQEQQPQGQQQQRSSASGPSTSGPPASETRRYPAQQ